MVTHVTRPRTCFVLFIRKLDKELWENHEQGKLTWHSSQNQVRNFVPMLNHDRNEMRRKGSEDLKAVVTMVTI